jgi:hypothetical protein
LNDVGLSVGLQQQAGWLLLTICWGWRVRRGAALAAPFLCAALDPAGRDPWAPPKSGGCLPRDTAPLLHSLDLRRSRASTWTADESSPGDYFIYTRAIVPGRVTASLWPKAVSLRWGRRSVLLLAAVSVAVFIAVRLSQRDLPVQTPAIEPLQTTVPLGPAPRVQRW